MRARCLPRRLPIKSSLKVKQRRNIAKGPDLYGQSPLFVLAQSLFLKGHML